jgi:hypothetical protein
VGVENLPSGERGRVADPLVALFERDQTCGCVTASKFIVFFIIIFILRQCAL